MSAILRSFWSLQFQSKTTYRNARRFKPSGQEQVASHRSKASNTSRSSSRNARAVLPFSMSALILPGVPTPMCVTPFCSSFTCSSICADKRRTAEWLRTTLAHHRVERDRQLKYLDVFCKEFYCFGCTLEGCQLPGNHRTNSTHGKYIPKVLLKEIQQYGGWVSYLMSSMVRRAELQTISRTTELFSVCCFWILAHLGQTRNNNGKIKQKKKKGVQE